MTKSEAARINGAKSRGPVTENGKHRSSQNALKHGLTAARDKAFVCQSESQPGWDGLYHDLTQRFNPVGQTELDLVAELAHARWRLRRCCTIETGVLDAEMDRQAGDLQSRYEAVDDNARLAFAFSHLAENKRTLDVLSRYEAHARRGFDRALRNLIQLQTARRQRESENEFLRNEPTAAADADVSVTARAELGIDTLMQ
jgi:hypothetical protein